MPKRPPDPRHVTLTPIKRRDWVAMPTRDGGYVQERAPEHGLYMNLGANKNGLYVSARDLWDALDLVIDIEDRDAGVG